MGLDLSGFARGLASQDVPGFFLEHKRLKLQEQDAANRQQEFEWRKRDMENRQGLQDYARQRMENVGNTTYDENYVSPDQGGLAGQTPEQALARQGDNQASQASVRALDNQSIQRSNPRTYGQSDAYADIAKRAAGVDVEKAMAFAEKARTEKTRESMSKLHDDFAKMTDEELVSQYGDKISSHTGNNLGFTSIKDPKTGMTYLYGVNQKTGEARPVNRDELLMYMAPAVQIGSGDFLEGLKTMQQLHDMKMKEADAAYKTTHGQALVAGVNNNAVDNLQKNEIGRANAQSSRISANASATSAGAAAALSGARVDSERYDLAQRKSQAALAPQLGAAGEALSAAYESGNKNKIASAAAVYRSVSDQMSAAGGKVIPFPLPGAKTALPDYLAKDLTQQYATEVSGLDIRKPKDKAQIEALQQKYTKLGLNVGYQDPIAATMPAPGGSFFGDAKPAAPAGGLRTRDEATPTGEISTSKDVMSGKTTFRVDGVPGKFTSRAAAEKARDDSAIGLSDMSRSLKLYGD